LGDLKLHDHSEHFFSWCKLKWSRDEVNNQLQILHGLGTTS
jgi:hypothetical protein